MITPIRALQTVIWAALAVLLQSCYHLQRATVPVETIVYPGDAEEGRRGTDLLVLLPGLGDGEDTFEKHGLIESVLESNLSGGLPFDVVAVNAHLKYYSNRTILERLKQDVVDPAHAAGTRRIHLVGVSLGGFGALLYLRAHPEDIASVTLLAPYLGEEEYYLHLVDESLEAPEVDVQENIWPWLLELPRSERAKIFLGFGEGDRFAQGNTLLGSLLDPSNTLTVDGGHDWSAWQELWPPLLARMKRAAEHGPIASFDLDPPRSP